MEKNNEARAFTRHLFKLAIPVALQIFMMSTLNMVDTIMVGQLGDVSIAAVGIGNQIYFLVVIYLLGVRGGCSVFTAQFYGKMDYERIKQIVGLGLFLGLSVILIYSMIVSFFTPQLMSLFSTDKAVIEGGQAYLDIVVISFTLVGITSIYSAVTRSTGNTRLPMIASFFGILMNVVFNYILIFGKLGFPEMGIKGAAWATVAARMIEMLILLVTIYYNDYEGAARLHHLFGFSKALLVRFIRQSGLMIMKDVVWGLGMTVYIGIFSRLSTEAIAAINISKTVDRMSFVLINGVASACLIMIGQKLGDSDYKTAYIYAQRFKGIVIALSVVIAGLLILVRPLIILLFNVTEVVEGHIMNFVMIRALFFVFLGYNNIAIIGIMRSGGDNLFTFVLDLVSVWFIGLPLAFFFGVVMEWPVIWVVVGMSMQEVIKAIACYYRVKSKKWMNSLVRDF